MLPDRNAPHRTPALQVVARLLLALFSAATHPLCAADTTDLVRTADSLAISNGSQACSDDSLKALTRLTVAGTIFSNQFVSPRFPCGGTLQIGARTPAATALPDRLNHDATLVFSGGYLFYAGQGLDDRVFHPGETAVVEQVRQLQFLSGMSELRIENGNDVSRSTTLLANDPTDGVLRQPGATVVISGDEKRSKAGNNTAAGVQPGFSTTLGAAERLVVASGMAKHLKGAGGAAGTTNRSIIPWMTIGSYQHPGMGGVATYDPEAGVRCLSISEYDRKILGTPDRNVWAESLELGENKTQTVNALVFIPYYSSQIGAGSTLTITSGFLQFGQRGPSAIGSHPQGGDYLSTGTIDFGAAEGVIWTCFEAEWGPNVIGPVIAGSGGLTIAGSNTLILQAANTYTGTTCVGDGVLQIGDAQPTRARLGAGDVHIAAGAMLRIKGNVVDAISDRATVTLLAAGTAFAGVMDLEAGVDEAVAGLVVDGKAQAPGTYGSTASAAAHKLDRYFSGSGVLTVRAAPH